MRFLVLGMMVLLCSCTEDQSRAIGQQPKKTVDRVTTDVNKAMQQGQGSERLQEGDK